MLSQEEVKKIADLARVHLSQTECERMETELSVTVDYVKKLSELDTKDITPINGGSDLFNNLRQDMQTPRTHELSSPEIAAGLVNAAPAKNKGYVKVKSVF